MAKILLVEDDNNLREIYEARLQAEGYTIVSAMDGEEALVIAKKEKPDLIISDVMMPRISGFEMLDILRNTEGLRDVRIIMLTALGQAEDKTRANTLGADRYLVKSQVTLEDIVRTAQELLAPPEGQRGPQATAAAAEQAALMAAASQPVPTTAVSQPQNTDASNSTTNGAQVPPTTPTASQAAPAAPRITPIPVTMPPTTSVPSSSSTPSVPGIPVAQPASDAPTSVTPSSKPISDTLPAPSSQPAPTNSQPFVAQPPAVPAATTTPAELSPVTPTAVPVSVAPSNLAPVNNSAPPPATTATPPTSITPVAVQATLPAAATQASGSVASQAQSSLEEEEAIKAQIESFVSQNSQTAPQPADEKIMADAINNLVSEAAAENTPSPATPKVISPVMGAAGSPASSPSTAQPSSAPTPQASTDDAVTVTGKKVIKPISSPQAEQKVGLDELLAKEGITELDEENHPFAPPPLPAPTTSTPAPPATAPSLPTTPHPPGHVISPNASAGVDPNSIAL